MKQRLKEDTVTGRFSQYRLIIESLPEFGWTGLGDYTNKTYYKLMEKAHMVRTVEGAGTSHWRREAYAVHNGYLEVAALYGAHAMVIFTLFIFSVFRYFKKLIHSTLPYAIVPFYACFIWMLANISNGVSQFRLYFILLLAVLTGSMVAIQNLSTNNKTESL